MAVAELLVSLKEKLRGTVMLVFQPAEENLPQGEIGGARRMIAEGAFSDPVPDVMIGLHVVTGLHAGTLGYRPGPTHASADEFRIVVHGRQTHGARPWTGVDPIVIGAQIVTALLTIQSRQIDVDDPSVLTVGTFQSGSRSNIIPNDAVMTGTLRTYSEERRQFIMRRVAEMCESVAAGMSASVDVLWWPNGYPTLINEPILAGHMASILARVVGRERLFVRPRQMPADDFAYFAHIIPSFFFHVGITSPDVNTRVAAPNHSPQFRVDETGLLQGLRGLLHIVVDYSGTSLSQAR
jgi:amidohydrolase